MITIKGVSLSKILEATLLLVFLSAVPAAAQNVLQGKVTDAKGQPLPGVMILISGTTNGTMTDLDGLYSIPVKKGETLEFSCLLSFAIICTKNSRFAA